MIPLDLKTRLTCSRVIFLLFFICLLMATSCSSLQTSSLEKARNRALAQGFAEQHFNAKGFHILGFLKENPEENGILRIYIEGDGFAWKGFNTISADPTPRQLTALNMAIHDPSPQVLYLGRPCQFGEADRAPCHPRYWSSHRYSETIINAVNDAIEQTKHKTQASAIILIGYSGGGTLATLLADKRQDVIYVITVAANLDHNAWTSLHGVSPLAGSMNAAHVASKIQHIPQVHFVGDRDKIVPVEIVESYRQHMTTNDVTPHVIVIPGYNHRCCWDDSWPDLLRRVPYLIQPEEE